MHKLTKWRRQEWPQSSSVSPPIQIKNTRWCLQLDLEMENLYQSHIQFAHTFFRVKNVEKSDHSKCKRVFCSFYSGWAGSYGILYFLLYYAAALNCQKSKRLQNIETFLCWPEQCFSHDAINFSKIDGSFLNTIYLSGFAANSTETLRPLLFSRSQRQF